MRRKDARELVTEFPVDPMDLIEYSPAGEIPGASVCVQTRDSDGPDIDDWEA